MDGQYEVQRKTRIDPEWKPLRQGTDQHPARYGDRDLALTLVEQLGRFGGMLRVVDTATGKTVTR